MSPEHGCAGVGDHTMNERNESIARMEASEIAPTWETIYDLKVTLAALRADLATAEREQDRYRVALAQYADAKSWMIRDYDGANCDYIGEGEGPELALRALGAARDLVTKSTS